MGRVAEVNQDKLRFRDRVILAVLIGIVIFIISVFMLRFKYGIDFLNILNPIRAWLIGKNIYIPFKQNVDPLAVPYPFTAYLSFFPFARMPDWLAIGLFMGVGCGVLAWFMFSTQKYWYLVVFLSWPFVYNILLAQFAPYAILVFFSASFLPFILFKPQLVLPFVLTQRPDRIGVIITGLILIISLIVYPLWPIDWLKSMHMQNYIGFSPLFLLPLGPLLLLALIRYREKRTWLLLIYALMPQRMVYDQLGVLLVAENRNEMIFLMLCSWLSFPALIFYGGWGNLPYGWKNWVLIGSYLPALIVVLLPTIRHVTTLFIGSYTTKRDELKET